MERFNIRCPDHFPMKCNLSPADKDYLLTKEKYKAFFIFQYNDQDEWLLPTIERYFGERTWRLFNAGKEGGTGTKFCNVCRYALASDFGIVSVTPFNYNVFQEIGIMQGLQKPLIYLLNPARKPDGKLPFDIDDQIYVEHNGKDALLTGMDKKISLVIEKVQLLSGFESARRTYVKEKVGQLSEPARGVLKVLVYEGQRTYYEEEINIFLSRQRNINTAQQYFKELQASDFIIMRPMSGGTRTLRSFMLNPEYRRYLEQLLWET